MRVSDVRKKYPEFFATVEAAVWDDCQTVSYKGHPGLVRPMIARRIAYNAAAVATLELHKIASRKKIIVAGKTSANTRKRKPRDDSWKHTREMCS
jgi:hypothetical protein